LRPITVFGAIRLNLQNKREKGKRLERTVAEVQLVARLAIFYNNNNNNNRTLFCSETTLSLILRELRLEENDSQKSKWKFVETLNYTKEGAIFIYT